MLSILFFLPAGLVVLFKGVTQNVTFKTLSKNQAVHGSHQCYCESTLKVSVLKCPSNRHHRRHGRFSSVLSSLSMFYPNLLLRDQYKALWADTCILELTLGSSASYCHVLPIARGHMSFLPWRKRTQDWVQKTFPGRERNGDIKGYKDALFFSITKVYSSY